MAQATRTVFRWESYQRDPLYVRFYRKSGELKGLIARALEFPELDPVKDKADAIAWGKEFRAHEARFLEFLRLEAEELKDAGDYDE
jgi:hypothetical protein